MAVVEVKQLRKTYGAVNAVHQVSFDVQAGEIFGFLGPNGAGKTTTILMLTTLLRPSGGRAVICGHDIETHPARVRESVGYVSQEIAVEFRLRWERSLNSRRPSGP